MPEATSQHTTISHPKESGSNQVPERGLGIFAIATCFCDDEGDPDLGPNVSLPPAMTVTREFHAQRLLAGGTHPTQAPASHSTKLCQSRRRQCHREADGTRGQLVMLHSCAPFLCG